MKKRKTLVQFDGSNFYNKMKRTVPQIHLTSFPYNTFIQKLTSNITFSATYYVGEIKKYPGNKKSQLLYSHQQALFRNLRKQNIMVKLGYLLKHGFVYQEKGVDVQIAVDIVRGAIKNEYDTIYVISSDTDLLPAILTARSESKEIVYVGFEKFMSRAMMRNCSSYIKLTKKYLSQFITQ